VGGATAGLLVPVGILWLVWDVNLLNVWAWNYRNHAGFYEAYPRTYWKWLLVNPLELTLAAGVPLVVLVVASYRRAIASAPAWTARSLAPYWGCALVWGVLWLSGKNSGEAARLWLVITPWLVWLTAAAFERPAAPVSESPLREPLGTRAWLAILALQLLACVATVTRVYGFHHGIG
jgi:methylthioxylose transferase